MSSKNRLYIGLLVFGIIFIAGVTAWIITPTLHKKSVVPPPSSNSPVLGSPSLTPDQKAYLECVQGGSPWTCKIGTPLAVPPDLFTSTGPSLDKPHTFSFSEDVFPGIGKDLRVGKTASMQQGEKFLLFSGGSAPQAVSVEGFINVSRAVELFQAWRFEALYQSPDLWELVSGVHSWALRREPESFPWLARISTGTALSIGVRNLPLDAITLGGYREMSEADLSKFYIDNIKKVVPASCASDAPWLKGFHYGTRSEFDVVRIDVGKPTYTSTSEAKILSKMNICHLTFINNRMVQREESVATNMTQKEREESEHTQEEITEQNWMGNPGDVVGYLSLDKGKTWYVLNTAGADDGIGVGRSFVVQRLDEQTPVFSESTYFSH